MNRQNPIKVLHNSNKKCFSALCCASVTRGFCCVWSEQLDADDWLNGWGDSKLVKSNLPRSKFPFI